MKIFNIPECLAVSATLRIAGALEKSTDVMKSMQALVKVPEIQATMMEMSKEMMKVRKSSPSFSVDLPKSINEIFHFI